MSSRPGHRKGGRPPKHPGVRKIARLKLPGHLYAAVLHDAAEAGVDRVDLVTFYLVHGWNLTHPKTPLTVLPYLDATWAMASSSPSLLEAPPLQGIDPNERYDLRTRMPETFHRTVSTEAWDSEVLLGELGAAYVLLGRNLHFDEQLAMPAYLGETLRQVQEHGQGVLLEAV